MKLQVRHRSDGELAWEAAERCSCTNNELRQLTENFGFAAAHRLIGAVAQAVAPGWDWIETTEPADASPTVCLTQPKDCY